MNITNEIEGILSDFNSITLKEVQKASLMRRKDSKFMFSCVHVPSLLSMVQEHYSVLEIDGLRSHEYQTMYYDTPDLEMYHMHHRGMANRHKVRFRKYGTSDIHFLEVKKKNSKGVTIKNRIKTNGMDAAILTSEEEFLSTYSPYAGNGIVAVLENNFNRITLVSESQTERITLDYGLRFSSKRADQQLDLPGLSIAEIKYENLLAGSPFNEALRQSHITPRRFSKYAIGTALLHPELKQNRFKVKVRKVNQINETYSQTQNNPHHA